ncbi:MAG: hypothetical protein QOD85_2560 [Gaiellaceae bacterium]|jgi:hypothetical protein|nr:hypothetical protein [Gaiellaceae bacterium]
MISLKRLLPLAFVTLAVVGAFAGSASGRAQKVQFIAGNSRVVQGNSATVNVAVQPNGARCSLAVRYKGGSRQQGLPSVKSSGYLASWTWQIPRNAHTGAARVTASCAGAGRASKSLIVIGQVLPPSVQVVKTGWSARVLSYGGTDVSYGVILANGSKTRDALDVNVLVNFVMPDNRLIGSATSHISNIAVGSQHAFGGNLTFPGGAPIARLEVVVEIGKGGPATRTRPGVSAVRVEPSPFEPQWCGSIEGEIQNDSTTRTLQQAELSGVVLDAAGNIIGGASGYGGAQLPPAARVFFKLSTGLSPIAYAKAASALVSVVPTYLQTP